MSKSPAKKALVLYGLLLLFVTAATAGITALLIDIFDHKQEAKSPFLKLVEVGENDVDPAKWGVNWPREYDGYKRTSEPSSTKYGGGNIGPEGGLPPQKAEANPWLTRIFAGYLFAVDYRDRRGHAFMLQDQELTKRNVPGENKQSGNCLHCHASIMPLYRKLGAEAFPGGTPYEQEHKGLERVSELGYWEAHKQLGSLTNGAHPVSCVDCHDPATMELRVTRPGFIDGIAKLAAANDEVPALPSIERWRKGERQSAYDPNRDASRQEMRSFVCAQCHVEYYCGKGMTLFFPWKEGLKAEQIERTYDGMLINGESFKDWTHAETGMDVLKAQHPEFELWSQGVHARSGVACADCHMPYQREGAMKVSEHWVRSPLLQMNRSCAVCHPYGDAEIKSRVEGIQNRHFALLTRAGQAATQMIEAINALRKPYDDALRDAETTKVKEEYAAKPDFAAKTPEEQDKAVAGTVKARLQAAWVSAVRKDPALQEIGNLQRAAQWRLDFVAAENSMGFHAPQEMARILAESIDIARQAEIKALTLRAGQ